MKNVTLSVPAKIGKEIEYLAKQEHRTVSAFLKETVRKYSAHENLRLLAAEGRKAVARKKLTPKDFGGPFAR